MGELQVLRLGKSSISGGYKTGTCDIGNTLFMQEFKSAQVVAVKSAKGCVNA